MIFIFIAVFKDIHHKVLYKADTHKKYTKGTLKIEVKNSSKSIKVPEEVYFIFAQHGP